MWEASRPRGTPYWNHGEHVGASADVSARGPEKKRAAPVGAREGRGTNRTCGLLSAAAAAPDLTMEREVRRPAQEDWRLCRRL